MPTPRKPQAPPGTIDSPTYPIHVPKLQLPPTPPPKPPVRACSTPPPSQGSPQGSPSKSLRDTLSANFTRVATLFRSLDVDGSGTINEPEFRKALVLLGHGDVPAEEIHDVFASLDTDGSGCVEYRELYLALGKPLPPALKARLHPPKTTLDATRARWGQGAFKPSSGSLGNNMRTLFGLRATDNDISASLRKLDDLFPDASPHSGSQERAIFVGMRVLIDAAEAQYSNALKNKRQLYFTTWRSVGPECPSRGGAEILNRKLAEALAKRAAGNGREQAPRAIVELGHDKLTALGVQDDELRPGNFVRLAAENLAHPDGEYYALVETDLTPEVYKGGAMQQDSPKMVLAKQMELVAKLSKQCLFGLRAQDAILHRHADELYRRLDDLRDMQELIENAMQNDELAAQGKAPVILRSWPPPVYGLSWAEVPEPPFQARELFDPIKPNLASTLQSQSTLTPEQLADLGLTPSSARTASSIQLVSQDCFVKSYSAQGKLRYMIPLATQRTAAEAEPASPEKWPKYAGPPATWSTWTKEEDRALLELVQMFGLPLREKESIKWARIAAGLALHSGRMHAYPRGRSACQQRWETLLSVCLSTEEALGLKKTQDMLFACRKSVRNAEEIMNEAAGVLMRAKSEMQVATARSIRLKTEARHTRTEMEERVGDFTSPAWMTDAADLTAKGIKGERARLAQMLQTLGPEIVTERHVNQEDRLKMKLDSQTLSKELGLEILIIETGSLSAPTSKNPRHFLRVRDTSTGEIALEWNDPGARTYGGTGGDEHDAFTIKIHGPQSGQPRSGASSAASTPRSTVSGCSGRRS